MFLAQHFLESLSKKLGKEIKGFSKKALKLIYDYPWPGNIREMENTIERCMIIAERDVIDMDDLPTHLKTSDSVIASDFTGNIFSDDTIIPFEKLKGRINKTCA